ncbi:profilin, required for normal timing of actin polymerization in response to thermal stress [Coemansia thaxteri]|uniref:Profilin n=1 Tax=Coemansia thaxteri TaxID=2663907 RepID=A0A9W8BK29_9FUNG|nr:profilin, required for normal timing of actin polymerization in response to thermal stress [Coemansia thaxteri]KAJ2004808.1 profilin, required for normal timing of actin polymerization in response to thermal stress [Coemansia thaxteri]KAJ2459599.1 profilin, required for normal timing of actin polymerization in response to thermal stress [Coemansia sp. RSA 2322]KAJ2483248.1 profilin, required for normal timing of actin polymerization in response to thermal stress [Coemansia sp. RSA 2320]
MSEDKSWQTYVDNNLVGSTYISEAAIYGIKGGLWAKSEHYDHEDDLFEAIKKGFSDSEFILATGLRVRGEKYMTLNADDQEMKFKCGGKGIICAKTVQAIIITFHTDEVQPGNANNALGVIADYLRSVGF